MQLVPIPENDASAGAPGASQQVTEVVGAMRALYARKGFQAPWIGYLAFEGEDCVGTCAFTGPPERGQVEIAYYTFPAFQQAGVATRMAGELVKIARLQSPAVTPIAHTLREEGPSTAILRKHGFTLSGDVAHPEDGVVWKWVLAGA